MQPLSNRTNTFTDSVIRRMTRIGSRPDIPVGGAALPAPATPYS